MRALPSSVLRFAKRLPGLAARFWRWAVPALITALAATQWVVERRPYDVYTDTLAGGYWPGALTLSWIVGFVIASPTMLYYRALIWLGERFGDAASRALVPALLILGAIVPPWIHDVVVDRQIPRRELRTPLPANLERVALVGSEVGARGGQLHCNDDCVRLLFGGIARRVLIVDAYELSPTRRTSARRPVPALRLERRPTCPTVATKFHDYADQAPIHEIQISPTLEKNGPSDRALALIASGVCPIVEMADPSSADVVLGSASLGPYGAPPQPNRFGILGGEFAFVDVGQGAGQRRIAQHIFFAGYAKWRTPLAFLPYKWGWLSGRNDIQNTNGTSDYRQKWRWAGLELPDLPPTGTAAPAMKSVPQSQPKARDERPVAWPIGPYGPRNNWWFFKWDLLILLAVMTTVASLALLIADRRR
jgi:hypothetical protein